MLRYMLVCLPRLDIILVITLSLLKVAAQVKRQVDW